MSEDEPLAIDLIFSKTITLLLMGEVQQALDYARKGLRSDPDSVPMRRMYDRIKGISRLTAQGGMHMKSQNHDAALKSWEDALAVSPSHPFQSIRE